MEYPSLKVPELRKILQERNLPTTGNKADLVARLQEDDKSKAPAAAQPGTSPRMSAVSVPRAFCWTCGGSLGAIYRRFYRRRASSYAVPRRDSDRWPYRICRATGEERRDGIRGPRSPKPQMRTVVALMIMSRHAHDSLAFTSTPKLPSSRALQTCTPQTTDE